MEPFKTAITLHFDRSWPFVTYAVLLLVVNIFTRKVYCRTCALGAALALPTKLRVFDWLKRRKGVATPVASATKNVKSRPSIRTGTSTTWNATTAWIAR